MAIELMKMVPREEIMRIMEMRDSLMKEIHTLVGIDKRLLMPPEPGERTVWRETVWMGYGEGDDGGGAALAAYRYGLCPFAESHWNRT